MDGLASGEHVDVLLVWSPSHLEVILDEYTEHYNEARPDRLALGQPVRRSTTTVGKKLVGQGEAFCLPVHFVSSWLSLLI